MYSITFIMEKAPLFLSGENNKSNFKLKEKEATGEETQRS